MRLQRGDHFERFLIKEPLGAGARGELYRAVDEKLARDVALRLFVEDESTAMLVAAAKKAASLDHPNIAATYDVGVAGDATYVVRELVRGSTLRARLDAGAVSLATCAEWMAMIASALEAAHALGVTHGALDADSIVVSEDAVKVLELSHVAGSVDPSGETMPLTTALEPIGVDVRAWGVLAEELLTATRERGARVDSLRAIANRARKSGELGGFTSMNEVVDALAGSHDTSTSSAIGERVSSRARVAFITGACLFAALAAGLVVKDRHGTELAAEPQKRAVAIRAESRMSSNPQATGAYRAGLQAARDGALDAAWASLDRAIALDPAFAAALLRRTILYNATEPSVQAYYQTAARLRADLNDHDRELLDAYEPATHGVPDLRATEQRLEQALAREPHDTDFAYNLARVRFIAGDYAGAVRACDAALAQDPAFAGALERKGYALLTSGDADGGLAALDRCLELSPVATSCLGHELDVTVNEGRCAEAIIKARRLIALDPNEAEWYRQLAAALYGAGESIDAVRTALESAWARTPAGDRANVEAMDRAKLAIVAGAFTQADDLLAKSDAAIRADPSEYDHYLVTAARLRLGLELGHSKQVRDLATKYLAQHAAWTPFPLFDTSIVAFDALYVSDALARTDYLSKRDAWWRSEQSHPKSSRSFSPAERWEIGFAAGVRTEEDARDALTHLPATLPGPNARDLALDEAIGRVQLLAGHLAEAVPHLRRAASSCDGLGETVDTIAWVRAQYELGTALESSGDSEGACAQYARVTRMWPTASATSSRGADERARLLRCAKTSVKSR